MTGKAAHGRRSTTVAVMPVDLRDPGAEFIEQELESNRRSERLLIPKTIIAFAIIAALIVIRQVFFA